MLGAPLLLGDDGYQISRSVRLRSSASAYFTRTLASAANQTKGTWSIWSKRGKLGARQTLISTKSSSSGTNALDIEFSSTDQLSLTVADTSNTNYANNSTAVYRDPSAWYHVVVSIDTTQATSANRLRVWVNNTQITSWSSSSIPAQNATLRLGDSTYPQSIGNDPRDGTYFDGYFAEFVYLDGQALDPSSFGQNDPITGVWQPKKYTGTYGTNGVYLNFSDNSAATAAAIGKDSSGNGNNWTPNNISVTAGVTYDSMIDTPTAYADGGNGRGNYAVMNPLDTASTSIIQSGNLQINNGAASYLAARSTFTLDNGKWYWEATTGSATAGSTAPTLGIALLSVALSGALGAKAGAYVFEANGNIFDSNGSVLWDIAGASANTTLRFAYDSTSGKFWVGSPTAWYDSTGGTTGDPATGANPVVTLSTAVSYAPIFSCYATTIDTNFGQRPFAYTPPTGFKALNTQNLPDSTIKAGNAYFDVSTWTGTGATKSVANTAGFQPDFVWLKGRSIAKSNTLADSVRGNTKYLFSDLTNTESTIADIVTSFNSNGFTLGSDSNGVANASGSTYVGWQWKKGATQGFDIVTYTGTGSARTVAHSLGVKPSMMIFKSRNNATGWESYHASLGATQFIRLNTTGGSSTNITPFNNTEPTSSVFTVGTSDGTNFNGYTYVAYLFAEVAGFSKFGSYTGNGSADGPFVYCGFRPRFIMVKCTGGTTLNWRIHDTSRDPYNQTSHSVYPNLANAEAAADSINFDILSNGFKLRSGDGESNGNGSTYIFAAFAENPFKNALAR